MSWIKIIHTPGWVSSTSTVIATDLASFEVFTSHHMIGIILARPGWHTALFASRHTAKWERDSLANRDQSPYEFVRHFWATCLAKRFAGVE